MIQNTLLDYINIRVSIAALRLVAPGSIVYLLCCALLPNGHGLWNIPLGVLATAEATFYLVVYLPRRRRLQAPPTHPHPTLTRAQRQLIFSKCLEAGHTNHLPSSSTSAESNSSSNQPQPPQHQTQPYPTGWFLDLAPDAHPKREDAIDWLLWALFSTSRQEINIHEYRDELEGYLAQIERVLGKELEPGHSNDMGTRSMRITLDPVRMLHRPLVWYFIVAVVDAHTSLALLRLGFKHYTPRAPQWSLTFPPRPVLSLISRRAPEGVAVPYWYRPHGSRTKMPVVFLHGIGIGLYPYIPFIRSIITGGSDRDNDEGIGMLLPELMPISMHMTPRSVPPRQVMLASLELILDSLQAQEEAEDPSAREQRQEAGDDGETGIRQPLLSSTDRLDGNVSFGSCSSQAPNANVDINTEMTGWNRVVMTAHSYGTFVAGWIVRLCVDADLVSASSSEPAFPLDASSSTSTAEFGNLANRIAHLILIDPIPILISNPAVAHNFLYRDPSSVCPQKLGSVGGLHLELELELENRGNLPLTAPVIPSQAKTNTNAKAEDPDPLQSRFLYSSAAAWQLWYFASRDADVARTLCRAFFWAEGGMWREEVRAFVGGRGSDDISGFSRKEVATGGRTEESRKRDKGRGKVQRGRNMAVVLGGMDQIVPAEAIRRYLTKEERWSETWVGSVGVDVGVDSDGAVDDDADVHNNFKRHDADGDASNSESKGKLEVLFNPRLDHAVIFDEEKWTEPLLEVVRRYVRDV